MHLFLSARYNIYTRTIVHECIGINQWHRVRGVDEFKERRKVGRRFFLFSFCAAKEQIKRDFYSTVEYNFKPFSLSFILSPSMKYLESSYYSLFLYLTRPCVLYPCGFNRH